MFYTKTEKTLKKYTSQQIVDSAKAQLNGKGVCVDALRKLLNGGIPVEDMFTVYSCVKPRGTVSILDGTIKGIEPFLNSVYLLNIPVSVNLES
jgi:hypothetical protein